MDIIELLESLPPMPESIKELNRAMNDKEHAISIITKEVETDPILSTLILKLINSPAYSIQKEITSIKHAIMLLGPDEVVRLSLKVLIEDRFDFNLTPYGLTEESFKALNMENVELAKKICEVEEYKVYIDKLISIAYFLNIGKLLSSKILIDSNLSEEFKLNLNSKKLSENEKYILGTTSLQVTINILEYYKLHEISMQIKTLKDIDRFTLGKLAHLVQCFHINEIGLKISQDEFNNKVDLLSLNKDLHNIRIS